MQLPFTLTLYIGRRFLQYFGIVMVPVAGVAWLVDTVEISRRAATREAMSFENALEMATYKLPHVMEDLIPFIVLLAAMITFFRLTRDSELTVIRAAGVSIWQFALPVILLAREVFELARSHLALQRRPRLGRQVVHRDRLPVLGFAMLAARDEPRPQKHGGRERQGGHESGGKSHG